MGLAECRLRPCESGTCKRLLELAEHEDPSARACAAIALGSGLEKAVPPEIPESLARLLQDESARVRTHAAHALGSLDPAAVSVEIQGCLIYLLADPERRRGCSRPGEAAIAMRRLGPAPAPAIQLRLLDLLSDERPQTRAGAAMALSQLDEATVTPAMRARLLTLLSDDVPEVRSNAARAIGSIDLERAGPEIRAQSLKLLREQDPDASKFLLTTDVETATEVTECLVQLLNDPSPSARSYAANMLRAPRPLALRTPDS